MEIKFEKKFSEQQIDKFINDVYINYNKNPFDKYVFDLTETEWISNHGLLLFTGLIKYFIEKGVDFSIIFIANGVFPRDLSRRVALHIVQIWEIWGIYKIIPSADDYKKYLGITEKTVKTLKEIHNINFSRPEIYDSYGISPFVCLDYIQNYEDDIIEDYLEEFHSLNDATSRIVAENKCDHPFVNGLLSGIISKEIYENFLSHFEGTFFSAKSDYAFLSLTLKGKLDEIQYNKKEIQRKLELNFLSEELPETKDFFFRTEYKNQSYISYSFFDFGVGIVETLREEYLKNHPINSEISDSDILKYAFQHDSSRHPIENIFEGEELADYIPRGLFDVISIVQRYNGLLIVRSCFGKILYNFGNTSLVSDAYFEFGNRNLFFPGTSFTIYLPAIEEKEFNTAPIKPNYQVPLVSKRKIEYIRACLNFIQ